MKKSKRKFPFIVTSNLFFIFPMLASIYMDKWIYFLIVFSVFVASVGFHYTRYHNKKGFSLSRFLFKTKKYKSERAFRISDWTLASLGSLYVFYYVYMSEAELNLRALFALMFLSAIVLFFYTFIFGNYNKYHPWFHVFTAIILGFIVLML